MRLRSSSLALSLRLLDDGPCGVWGVGVPMRIRVFAGAILGLIGNVVYGLFIICAFAWVIAVLNIAYNVFDDGWTTWFIALFPASIIAMIGQAVRYALTRGWIAPATSAARISLAPQDINLAPQNTARAQPVARAAMQH